MTDRSSLGRMIILVSFAIFALIIYSVRLSNRSLQDLENPVFKKTIPWQYEDAQHQLLLHSLELGAISFTAYSIPADTFIRISTNDHETQWIKNQLVRFNYTPQKCNHCHIEY